MSAFFLSRRLKSFRYALQGARVLSCTQHNAWIHAVATAAVIAAGLSCRLSRFEWALLVIAIGLVWMAEVFNTAIEFLADEVTEEQRDRIGKAKDLAAFAVLVSAGVSAILGAVVFLPHLLMAIRSNP